MTVKRPRKKVIKEKEKKKIRGKGNSNKRKRTGDDLDKNKRKGENNKRKKTGNDSESDDTIILDETTEKPEKEDPNIKTEDAEDFPKLTRSSPGRSNGLIWQLLRYNCY